MGDSFMKKWLMAVVLGTVLALGACGGGGSDDAADTGSDANTEENGGDTVDTAAAEEAYKGKCASCHGQDLSGNNGPDLTSIGSKYSAEEIEDIIVDGIGTMPPGLLSGDEATAVAEWLADHK